MSYIKNQDIPVGSALNRLGSLSDVNINNPQNGDTIVYNSTTGKWENGNIAHYKKTTGTGSATLSAALAALTDNEYLHSFISINDGGYNIGNHLLRPYDLRAGLRYYYDALIPFNASNIAVSWQAIRNNSANTFSYTLNVQPVSGSYSSTDKTSSIGAWELYIAEGA